MSEAISVTNIWNSRGEVRPRSPWVAVALSFCPGLGQHYAGHIVRGVAVYIALIVVSWLAAIAFMYTESKISVAFLSIPFVFTAWIVYDAWQCAAMQDKHYRLRWFNRVWVYAAVTLGLMATVNPLMDSVIGQHIMRAYFTTSTAMEPAVLHRDLLLIDRMSTPERGDIALLDFSPAGQQSKLTSVMGDQPVRRIIAVPGDTIEMRAGEVWLNGKKLDEPYVKIPGEPRNFAAAVVPENSVFVLCDNRSFGLDSSMLGFISRDRIYGRITKVFWSWNLDEGIRWDRTALSL